MSVSWRKRKPRNQLKLSICCLCSFHSMICRMSPSTALQYDRIPEYNTAPPPSSFSLNLPKRLASWREWRQTKMIPNNLGKRNRTPTLPPKRRFFSPPHESQSTAYKLPSTFESGTQGTHVRNRVALLAPREMQAAPWPFTRYDESECADVPLNRETLSV